MRPESIAIAAGAIAIAVGLTRKAAQDSASEPAPKVRYSDAELDALTRLLLSETSNNESKHSADERRAIIQTAINRHLYDARKPTLLQVATPPGIPNWNASTTYRKLWTTANTRFGRAAYTKARAFVKDYLDGNHPNQIGTRQGFLHWSGMRRCAASEIGDRRGKFKCARSQSGGQRWFPVWSVKPDAIEIGRGRFS